MDTKEVKVKKPKNFLNNKDMIVQIQLSKAQGKMNDELAKMCMLLVERYATHPQFFNIYSYREDMIAFAIMTLFRNYHHFNADKSNNPFAYYTQITRHAFYQYVNMEKKQRDIKNLFSVDLGVSDQEYDDTGFNEAEIFGSSPEADKKDAAVFDSRD